MKKHDHSSREILFTALAHNAFPVINKTLLEKISLMDIIVLSNLIDKYHYFTQRNMDEDGWFYLTEKQQIEQIGVSIFTLQKTIKNLENKKLIKKIRKGIPARIFYQLNIPNILNLLTTSNQGD